MNPIIKVTLFQRIIRNVEDLASSIEDPCHRAALYDYAIWCLGSEIADHGRVSFFTSFNPKKNETYEICHGINVPDGVVLETQEFDLAKIPTYTGPWNIGKMISSLKSVLYRGFDAEKAAKARNNGIYYKELHFAVMGDGRHHTSAAICNGCCPQKLTVHSLTPLFPLLDTNGIYFIPKPELKSSKKIVEDYRLAAMYRLAQRKWELGLDMAFSYSIFSAERPKCPPHIYCTSVEYAEDFMRKHNDIVMDLHSQLAAKDDHIRWLENRLKKYENAGSK